MSLIQAGVYRHYKGQDYQVFNVAHHSETEQPLVAYRCLYGDFSWWVRPVDMFKESVEKDGTTVARFAYIKPFSVVDYPDAPDLSMFNSEAVGG